jgi:phospholipase C
VPSPLDAIEHVVLVMMENRSFDQMLGFLTLDEQRPGVDGPRPSDGVARLTDDERCIHPDPPHDWNAVHEQLRGNGKVGFVNAYRRRHAGADPRKVAGYYPRRLVPTYGFFADHYTICDSWYASAPGATWTNRLYALCGTAHGYKHNAPQLGGLRGVTIFELLDNLGVSNAFYGPRIPWIRFMAKYTTLRGHPLRPFARFAEDVDRGALPAFSWIDPDFGVFSKNACDDHPPHDILAGQKFLAGIYETLISNEALWRKTLLVITYDEHGGFFDHARAPARPAGELDPAFQTYGVRVPAFIVSPHARRGAVCKTLFDHCSPLRTLMVRFGLQPSGTPHPMTSRVQAAHDLSSALAPGGPRSDRPRPPAIAEPTLGHPVPNTLEVAMRALRPL